MIQRHKAWGFEASLNTWAHLFGIDRNTIVRRMAHGATLEEALLTTKREYKGRQLFTWDGRTQCASAWAKELGITSQAFYARLKAGDTGEKLFRLPAPGTSKTKVSILKRIKPVSLDILYIDPDTGKPSVMTKNAPNFDLDKVSGKILMLKPHDK